MAHPGFQVSASYAGNVYYGFGNYWGINFQGLDLNTLADAQPIANVTVTDQRPGNAAREVVVGKRAEIDDVLHSMLGCWVLAESNACVN